MTNKLKKYKKTILKHKKYCFVKKLNTAFKLKLVLVLVVKGMQQTKSTKFSPLISIPFLK